MPGLRRASFASRPVFKPIRSALPPGHFREQVLAVGRSLNSILLAFVISFVIAAIALGTDVTSCTRGESSMNGAYTLELIVTGLATASLFMHGCQLLDLQGEAHTAQRRILPLVVAVYFMQLVTYVCISFGGTRQWCVNVIHLLIIAGRVLQIVDNAAEAMLRASADQSKCRPDSPNSTALPGRLPQATGCVRRQSLRSVQTIHYDRSRYTS